MEKIRELSALLQAGIEEYDEQLKTLQQERLKYIRLSVTDGFGDTEGDSKNSWLLHLQQLEESLGVRLTGIRQAIQNAAKVLGDSPVNRKNRHFLPSRSRSVTIKFSLH